MEGLAGCNTPLNCQCCILALTGHFEERHIHNKSESGSSDLADISQTSVMALAAPAQWRQCGGGGSPSWLLAARRFGWAFCHHSTDYYEPVFKHALHVWYFL